MSYKEPEVNDLIRELKRYGSKTDTPCFIPTHLKILMRAAAAYIEYKSGEPIYTAEAEVPCETEEFVMHQEGPREIGDYLQATCRESIKRRIADWVLQRAKMDIEPSGRTDIRCTIRTKVAVFDIEPHRGRTFMPFPVSPEADVFLQKEIKEMKTERRDIW